MKTLRAIAVLFAMLVAAPAFSGLVGTPVCGELTFGTSHPITVPAVGSGNSLTVNVNRFVGTTGTPITGTDNGGAAPSYTLDYGVGGWDNDQRTMWVLRRSNITDAPTQVTINTGGDAAGTYCIREWEGSIILGQSNVSRGTGATPTVSVTTTTDGEIGIGIVSNDGGTVISPPAGWTRDWTEDGAYDMYAHDDDLGTAGSKAFAPTFTSTDYAVAIVTYQVAGGGGGTQPPRSMHYKRLMGKNAANDSDYTLPAMVAGITGATP